MAELKSLRETCIPRDEVLTGELRDEMFAANLSAVVRGQAHKVYQDPDLFFANTYPTERVRTFVREVAGRLSGKDPAAAAFFRLDTPFGGGKTHTLISLYHLIGSEPSSESMRIMGVDASSMPSDPVKVVTIVGGDLDPADGVRRGDVVVHHMWGEIAYQLAGEDGYRMVENADAQGIAPGSQFLDELVGNSPVLFMIDEPAEYMRRMGHSAGQLSAFIKTLSEWATAPDRPRVLVLTLAWSAEARGDAFAGETAELVAMLDETFREVQSVVSRPARIVTPSERQDIEPILRRRLFQNVDMNAAAPTAEAYYGALRNAAARDTSLPTDVQQASYRQQLEAAYPFHPSFIEALDGKLATIPNFQRTRGALRLVARVIRSMWDKNQNDVALIHPFCVDLSDPEMVEELVGRLDRTAYASVVSYDVADSTGASHAQEIDRNSFVGHPPYTERIATTLLLHSLPDPPARGANLPELLASALTPRTDPAHLLRALEYLSNEAWHLDYEGNHYSFRTEPSLNKIVLDETQSVSQHDARVEVDRRVRQIWRSAGLEVSYFPSATEDLPDTTGGRLVLMHWDTADVTSARNDVPATVHQLANYKGVQQDYRRYRNTLYFLAADSDRINGMLQSARRWLALEGLVRSGDRMEELRLSGEHRDRLRNWHKDGELNARIAITRAYRHLFYPDGMVQNAIAFRHHALNVDDQGSGRVNHTETVLNVLVNDLDKVKISDSGLRAPVRVKQEVFGTAEGALALSALVERYSERPRLPLIISPTYFQEIVSAGVKSKTWLYFDAGQNTAYDTLEPVGDIVFDADHMLMLPDEVVRRGISVWSPEPKPEPPKKDDDEGVRDVPKPSYDKPTTSLSSVGEPRRALAELTVGAQDQGWQSIRQLSMNWTGEGGDAAQSMRHLGTLMGQLSGSGATVACNLTCEFGDKGVLETQYRGDYARYQSMAGTLETQASQADGAFVDLTLTLEFANGLAIGAPELSDLRDAFELVSLGHTTLAAERHDGAP